MKPILESAKERLFKFFPSWDQPGDMRPVSPLNPEASWWSESELTAMVRVLAERVEGLERRCDASSRVPGSVPKPSDGKAPAVEPFPCPRFVAAKPQPQRFTAPEALGVCYCSDRMSGGVPCQPGQCPNVPAQPAESPFSQASQESAWERALKILEEAGEDVPALLKAGAENIARYGKPIESVESEPKDPTVCDCAACGAEASIHGLALTVGDSRYPVCGACWSGPEESVKNNIRARLQKPDGAPCGKPGCNADFWRAYYWRSNSDRDRMVEENARLQKALDVCSAVHEHNAKLKTDRDRLQRELMAPTYYTSNNEAGDGQTMCELCDEPADEPHTLTECVANLRSERDSLLGDQPASGSNDETSELTRLTKENARLTSELDSARDWERHEANAKTERDAFDRVKLERDHLSARVRELEAELSEAKEALNQDLVDVANKTLKLRDEVLGELEIANARIKEQEASGLGYTTRFDGNANRSVVIPVTPSTIIEDFCCEVRIAAAKAEPEVGTPSDKAFVDAFEELAAKHRWVEPPAPPHPRAG